MMNERAWQILAFIQRFARDRGLPPTIREIGDEFHIRSTNGVRYYLSILEKQGYLRRRGKISRGIEVTPRPSSESGIPILGRVAAGDPILAEESFEGRLEPGDMFGDPQGLFALRVRGDSMIGSGILENDYVIVRKQDSASPGQIIVGLLDDEATVKYYQPRKGHIELIGDNPTFQPIVVTPDRRFSIIGIVKGVMRTV